MLAKFSLTNLSCAFALTLRHELLRIEAQLERWFRGKAIVTAPSARAKLGHKKDDRIF